MALEKSCPAFVHTISLSYRTDKVAFAQHWQFGYSFQGVTGMNAIQKIFHVTWSEMSNIWICFQDYHSVEQGVGSCTCSVSLLQVIFNKAQNKCHKKTKLKRTAHKTLVLSVHLARAWSNFWQRSKNFISISSNRPDVSINLPTVSEWHCKEYWKLLVNQFV